MDIGLTADLKIHSGQSVMFRVKNQTGSTIYKGQPVYVSGVIGGGEIMAVAPFAIDSAVEEIRFIGLATDDISNVGDRDWET